MSTFCIFSDRCLWSNHIMFESCPITKMEPNLITLAANQRRRNNREKNTWNEFLVSNSNPGKKIGRHRIHFSTEITFPVSPLKRWPPSFVVAQMVEKSRNRLNLPLSIVPSCSDSNSGAFFLGFTLSWPFSPVHPLCFWLILSQTHSNAFSSLVYALYIMLLLCLKVLFILSCSLRIFNAMCSISYSSLISQVCSLTKYFALSSDLSLFLVLFHSCSFFLSFF